MRKPKIVICPDKKPGTWITLKKSGRRICIHHTKRDGAWERISAVIPTAKVLGGISLAAIAAVILKRKPPLIEDIRKAAVIHGRTEASLNKWYQRVSSAWLGMKTVPPVVRSAEPAKLPGTAALIYTPHPGALEVEAEKIIGHREMLKLISDKYKFSRLFYKHPEHHLDTYLASHFKNVDEMRKYFASAGKSFLLKPRFGSLGTLKDFPTGEWANEAIEKYIKFYGADRVIVQELVPVANEFRVHVIRGKVYAVMHRWGPPGEIGKVWKECVPFGNIVLPVWRKDDIVKFTEKAIRPWGKKLHAGLDIIQLPDGSFRILEANPLPASFMHPYVSRKFHRAVTGVWTADIQALAVLGGAVGAWSTVTGTKTLVKKFKEKGDYPKIVTFKGEKGFWITLKESGRKVFIPLKHVADYVRERHFNW